MGGAAVKRRINIFLVLVLCANVALWAGSRKMYAAWGGVPPVPSRNGAISMSLGDEQFAYRTGALSLQTLGDGGGRVTSLLDYDYKELGRWFNLLHSLDPASEHLPAVVAYYFGATRKPESVAVVVDYLEKIGQNPAGEKWRWLVQAAFLAQHRMKDLDRALEISYLLARMNPIEKPLPIWAREFPAFVLEAQGNKEKAREMIKSVVESEKSMPWQEANFLEDVLVNRLDMSAEEAHELLKKWQEEDKDK